jgi:hypothetical protein
MRVRKTTALHPADGNTVKKKAPILTLGAASMMWSCTVRVYAQRGNDAMVSYEESSVSCHGGETTIGDVDLSELTSGLGRLLLHAEDQFRLVGLAGVWAEPALPEAELEFLALCWCSEHDYEAVAHILAMLDADRRRQIFELFGGYQNDEFSNFCDQLLSLQEAEFSEVVGSIGAVIDRTWFDLAAADVASRAAAELDRLERIKAWEANEHERIYGRPDEVREAAALVERFGTKIPLGYLAHATEYARPEPGKGIIEALLLSWGTQEGDMPEARWRHVDGLFGELAFFGWVLDGREEVTLAEMGRRRDHKTKTFFRKLNRLIELEMRSGPPFGGSGAFIAKAIYEYFLKLKAAVPRSYR